MSGHKQAADHQGTAGREAPITSKKDDYLERWRVAQAIHRTISSIPPGWSLRIAVTGAWGSGKTSVLKLLKEMQLEHEHDYLVVEYSAWRATGESGILSAFYEALDSSVRAANVDRGRQQRWLLSSSTWFRWLGRAGGTIALEASKAAAAAQFEPALAPILDGIKRVVEDGANSIVDALAAIKPEHIDNLRKALAHRRIVVYIDDLDRADPAALPKTLLALRDLLDWPGFVFVLAFDRRVVASALAEYSRAYGDLAERFLEKIIDVAFELPRPSPKAAQDFAERVLQETCDFVPEKTRRALAPYFPAHPRRTKLAARELAVLKQAAARHDPEELDWLSLGLIVLLRSADRQVADLTLEECSRNAGSDGQEDAQDSRHVLTEARKRFDDEEWAWVLRVRQALVDGLGSRFDPSEGEYLANLVYREPGFTFKEYRAVLAHFIEHACLPVACIAEAARRSGRPQGEDDVAVELARWAVVAYSKALTLAADSRLAADHLEMTREALHHLRLLSHLASNEAPTVIQSAMRRPEVATLFLQAVDIWQGFTRNERDRELRSLEGDLLRRLCALSSDPVALYMATDPHRRRILSAEREALMNTVREELSARVAEAAVRRLIERRPIRELFSNAQYCWLFQDAASPLYGTAGFEELRRALQEVEKGRPDEQSAAIRNLGELLDLNFVPHAWTGAEEQVKRHAGFFALVWSAFSGPRRQHRAAEEVRKRREGMLKAGMPPELVPLPAWLHEGPGLSSRQDS